MPKVSGFCPACGKAIEFYLSQPRKFCSRACDIDWHKRTNQPRKKRRGTTTPCEVCGVPVYANRSERLKGAGRYCSPACHNIAQSKPPVLKECETCGAEMRLKPSQAGRRYCSRKCMGRAAIKRPLDRTYNGKPVRLDPHGYVLIWEPSYPSPAAMKGWAYEHRVIAAGILGRPLTSDEQVDHINRNKQDNRPENLQVLDGITHSAKTAADNKQDRIDLAEYRRRYGPLTP